MAYNLTSDWRLRTTTGWALGKGIGAMGLSASAGIKKIQFLAVRYDPQRGKVHELTLSMTLTGVQIGVEKSVDLIESFTGAQVAIYKPEKDSTGLLKNEKKPAELKTSDFLGPCALASFDLSKASVSAISAKFRGASML